MQAEVHLPNKNAEWQIRIMNTFSCTAICMTLSGKIFLVKLQIFNGKLFSKTCKTSKHSKCPFFLLPSNDDSLLCSCILSSWENGIPLNKLLTLGGRLLNLPKRKHVLKRAESHRCEVNTLRIFACNFSTFFKVSQRD